MHNKKHNFQSYPSHIQYINSIKFRQTVQSRQYRQGPLISSTTLVCQSFHMVKSAKSHLSWHSLCENRLSSVEWHGDFSRTACQRDASGCVTGILVKTSMLMDRRWLWIRHKSKNLPFSRFKKVTSTSDMFFFTKLSNCNQTWAHTGQQWCQMNGPLSIQG